MDKIKRLAKEFLKLTQEERLDFWREVLPK